jgi:hypothetical protein
MKSIFDDYEDVQEVPSEELDTEEQVSAESVEEMAGEQVITALKDQDPRGVVEAFRNLIELLAG